MSEDSRRPKRRPAQFALQGILPLDPKRVASDLIAGATLAALAIPEVMGYTRIAGTPVVSGLYSLLVPAIIFALLGSSRRLVVGADSATAAIMAAALTPLAIAGSAQWMQYASAMALGCAVVLMIARIARLAFLADFLSRTVLAGFLTGVGLQVAIGELPGMLGLQIKAGTSLGKLLETAQSMAMLNPGELAIAAAVIAFVVLVRRVAPRFPAALVAVVVAIAASQALDWSTRGIAVVGALQGGLPGLSWPDLSVAIAHGSQLASPILAMSVVILAQSAATSRAYAWKYDEEVSENQDIVGLALANAGAAVSGSFVVNGSPTKTQMVDSAGGHSQIAHLTMAAVVAAVLMFATGPIAALPRAALAAIVFLIGIDLVHVREMRRILAERPAEFWIALATACCVLAAGVEQAIILAMVLSLIDHVRRGYRPHNSLIVRGADGHAQLCPIAQGGQYQPGLIVYRFSHSMYYANCEVLSREVLALASSARPALRWFVIDLDAVDDIDYSAGATLASLSQTLARSDVQLGVLRASPFVTTLLQRYAVFGPDGAPGMHFSSVRDMRHAFQRASAQASSKEPSSSSAGQGLSALGFASPQD